MTISTNDFQLNYQYADAHPLTGTSFYRVKVIGKRRIYESDSGCTNQ